MIFSIVGNLNHYIQQYDSVFENYPVICYTTMEMKRVPGSVVMDSILYPFNTTVCDISTMDIPDLKMVTALVKPNFNVINGRVNVIYKTILFK